MTASVTKPGETLNLCVAIIACDNERTIGQTLSSVDGLARRTIVVDSGSTDGTIELCRAHGAEVIEHAWEGYVRQKQFALEQCDTP
jgi:glycosyltransferase involved in cell wall biosynthesis